MIECNLYIREKADPRAAYPLAEVELINGGQTDILIKCNPSPFQYIDILIFFDGTRIPTPYHYGSSLARGKLADYVFPAGQKIIRQVGLMTHIQFRTVNTKVEITNFNRKLGVYSAQTVFTYSEYTVYSSVKEFVFSGYNTFVPTDHVS